MPFSEPAKIEVGGPYLGVEFHHSRMIPQRISFFYPVANSIDHSKDYWTRDTSLVGEWLLRIGEGEKIQIGRKSCQIDLSPYSVKFYQNSTKYTIKSIYQFCENKPAMVITINITNNSDKEAEYKLDTRLNTSIRTSHTYQKITKSWSEIKDNAIYTHFNEKSADSANIFITNAGKEPDDINSRIDFLNDRVKQQKKYTRDNGRKPVAQFVYKERLEPGQSMEIVQIIGSSKRKESQSIVNYLNENYQFEVNQYEKRIRDKVFPAIIETGSAEIDHSLVYANTVLEANAHYLDEDIVPMPCPAEYNFYFTHDVLLTDLTAVNFDLERVKKDLNYIIDHANRENIIPHAYYWKDGKYVTEYSRSDNWNNFWFIQVCAKYIRHSNDHRFLEKMFPYLQKSIQQSLLTLENDNIMWSYRPDWWDIGHNYGPSSYMTILAIKSLRDFVYISTVLDKKLNVFKKYSELADKMHTALNKKLWHEEMDCLVNYYTDGSLDRHYYIGSLLAASYGLLNSKRQNKIIQTVKEKLLDPKVGLYNAFPMNFHKLGEKMKFVGDEAGSKFDYLNGGVWSHGNAWYAKALIANQQKELAARFIERTMSLHGIMDGPNGQPAYYEVRNANKNNPGQYGKVDKPQFLWAAAWYINATYRLYGVAENNWNVRLDPFLRKDQEQCKFNLYLDSKPLKVDITGEGKSVEKISYGGKQFASTVFPQNMSDVKDIRIKLGQPQYPFLFYTDAILKSCEFDEDELKILLEAFPGHSNQTIVLSPTKPKKVMVDGAINDKWESIDHGHYKKIILNFVHEKKKSELLLNF